MSSPSMYHVAMQTLINSFRTLLQQINEFYDLFLKDSYMKDLEKYKMIFAIWRHPKGIANLVNIISLGMGEEFEEFEDAHKQNCSGSGLRTDDHQIQIPSEPQCKVEENSEQIEEDAEENQVSAKPSFEFQQSKGQSGVLCKQYIRGPYKTYSTKQKQLAVVLLNKDRLPITEISRRLNIPCKNIKRWATNGIDRKVGGGRRRLSPQLEQQTVKWLRQNYTIGQSVHLQALQLEALRMSNDPTFKASRGWALGLIRRFKLKHEFQFI